MTKSFKINVLLLFVLAACSLFAQPKAPLLITPEGVQLVKANKTAPDGTIHQVKQSALQLLRTKEKAVKGTVLLLPGGEYQQLQLKAVTGDAVKFFNQQGYDVALLQYHINAGTGTRIMAMQDALQAVRYLKKHLTTVGLHSERLVLCGIGAGAHLAARTVQRLNGQEQPDDVVLWMPSYLNETLAGSVFPAVMPPLTPRARLLVLESVKEPLAVRKSAQEYSKMWIGYDGVAVFKADSDSISAPALKAESRLGRELTQFLEHPISVPNLTVNPAAVAVEGYNPWRHAEKLKHVAQNKYDLILIGNSITNNFEKAQYQPVWNQFFAPRNALNLGFSGYRTENLLWNIEHGELEGQSPKVAILEIGTNNVDEVHYPTRHTAGQLAGGIEAVVKLMRAKMPQTKIIIMRCFPGCYGGPNPTSHRIILERASELVSKLADNKDIFYCDVNHVFLNMDGSINHEMMPDWLHPSPAGAKAWAQAMEPLLSKLMGDSVRDTEIPTNTAIVPVTKLENDSYDWFARHADVLQVKDSINPEIVMIGNSITHFWGGEPLLKNPNGTMRAPNGPAAWKALFEPYRALNMGFGWDRTQNVLWRLDNGELDGLHPRVVVIENGTNNTSQTSHARKNTAPEIVEGLKAICLRVRSKVPQAKIVLMAVFPREEKADHPRRQLIDETNKLLREFATQNNIRLIELAPKMLSADGTLSKELCDDFCHPTEKGYRIWADAIRDELVDY